MKKTRLKRMFQACDRELQLGKRTLLMGILNVTPDSFSDGGRGLSSIRRSPARTRLSKPALILSMSVVNRRVPVVRRFRRRRDSARYSGYPRHQPSVGGLDRHVEG